MKHIKKYILAAFLAIAVILTVAACANGERTSETDPGTGNTSNQSGTNANAADNSAAATPEPSSDKTLIVYFSRTSEQYTVGVIDHGNTAIVAEMIADETGADLWEVLPADDHYPMTYSELTDVARREQNDKARPAYEDTAPDLSEYGTVFIGAPVWWGDWPMIMYTFFEQNSDELAGKTLIPFSTHEGSGLSGFDRKLASAIPGAAVEHGLAIRGNDAQNSQESVREDVKSWLKELGF